MSAEPVGIPLTAFTLAQRWTGTSEVQGAVHNPAIVAMLRLDGANVVDDETAWCSAFANYIAWILRLPRSKSLRARSWLEVGRPIELAEASAAFDVVILKRGDGVQPGPNVIDAPGHVGFFASLESEIVTLLGGNQGNTVSLARFRRTDVLGVRRLWP